MAMYIEPTSESVRADLRLAPGWDVYERRLRQLLVGLLSGAEVDCLEVSELYVGEPLPAELQGLRNGTLLHAGEAIDWLVRVAGGKGPFGALSAPGIRFEGSWDGSLYVLGNDLRFDKEDASESPLRLVHLTDDATHDIVVTECQPADETFWDRVAGVRADLKLVCERWAYGPLGTRWFNLTTMPRESIEAMIWPRSTVSVYLDPIVDLTAVDADEGFTAFCVLDKRGELEHREFPFGVESLDEVIGDGWRFAVSEEVDDAWIAVVPDNDGVAPAG